MPSYVGTQQRSDRNLFLRAINIGKRQVRMAEARAWLTEAGFTDVETYIQTGNVRVTTPKRSVATVERALEEVFLGRTGFEVPSIVFTPAELRQVYDDALAFPPPPYADRDDCRRFVVLFKEPPSDAEAEQVAAYETELERARVVDRVAHVWIAGPFAEAKVFGALAKVFAPGTNRNLKVIATLAERWT